MSHTYFIQSENGGPIKIGYTSRDPLIRLAALQTGNPTKLKIIGLFEGDKEKEFHYKFSNFRVSGEWFEASKQLLDFVQNKCKKNIPTKDSFQIAIGFQKIG